MPITYRIDHDRRLVDTSGEGVVTSADFFTYQKEVWSRPEVIGFDEIVDMTRGQLTEFVSRDLVASLAELSAGMDRPDSPSKLAIIAHEDLHFGLGRMYQHVRESDPRSSKSVGVFRTRAEALAWLGRSPSADEAAAPAASKEE